MTAPTQHPTGYELLRNPRLNKGTAFSAAERREWAAVYVRGLLMEGQRKSIEPIAARVGEPDAQGLQQFVNQSPWAWEPVQEAVALDLVDRLCGPQGPEAVTDGLRRIDCPVTPELFRTTAF